MPLKRFVGKILLSKIINQSKFPGKGYKSHWLNLKQNLKESTFHDKKDVFVMTEIAFRVIKTIVQQN